MTRISKSEQQLNAEALRTRGSPYSQSYAASASYAFDYRVRQPDDLRGLVRAVRRAYEDEVPTKLHDAQIGEGGTPRMTAQAEGYMFGYPGATDGRAKCTCPKAVREALEQAPGPKHIEGCPAPDRPVLAYHLTPFRATLDRMEKGDVHRKRRAAIVRHITIGGQEPATAAIMEEAHPLDARIVAEDALRVFMANMTDVKLDLHREPEAA